MKGEDRVSTPRIINTRTGTMLLLVLLALCVAVRADDDVLYESAIIREQRAKLHGVNQKYFRTIKEVETDQLNFIGKPVIFVGEVDVSNYYNFGYNEAAATHFAFIITTDTGFASVYMERSNPKAQSLRRKIISRGESLQGAFGVKINPKRFQKYQEGQTLLADLITYRLFE